MRVIFLVLIILGNFIFAQSTAEFEDNPYCFPDGQGKVSFSTPREDGLYLPADGTVRILILWCEFKGDQFDVNNVNWETGEDPEFMGDIIDASWDGTPRAGTLTDYFNKASFGKLKLIGDEYHLITNSTRAQYLANGDIRDDIHRELIQKLDSTISFSAYDNWTYYGADESPRFSNSSDSIVDMIMFVWRNVALDIDNSDDRAQMKRDLDLNHFGYISSNYSDILVDGNTIRIKTGVPSTTSTTGSGVTIIDALGINYKGKMIHEFAHYLLGSNFMHIGFGSWGMLDEYGSRSNCPAVYERILLGWVPGTANTWDISTTTQTTSELTLRDYMKYGDYIRIDIDASNHEYFYLENHQREYSTWDNPDRNYSSVKGLYITHQRSPYPRWNYFLCPADGRFDWDVKEMSDNPWLTRQLPVWENNEPAADGPHDCERINWSFGGSSGSDDIIYWYNNDDKKIVYNKTRFLGDGKDQFDESNRIFSPWALMNSNDKDGYSTGIAVEVVDVEEDGDIRVKVYVNTGINARPSNVYVYPIEEYNGDPKITWHENGESDLNYYFLYRSTSFDGTYSQVTSKSSGTSTYTDTGAPSPPSTGYLFYKIMVMDYTYKASGYSDIRKYDAPPSVPGNFQLTTHQQGGTYRPKLTWDICTEDDIEGYRVFRKIDGESVFTQIASVSAATTSFIDYFIIISSHWWENESTVYYYLQAYDDDTNDDELTANTSTLSTDYLIDLSEDELNELSLMAIPSKYKLFDNFPNPFNPSTSIKFAIPEKGHVKIKIYNSNGQLVSVLANEEYSIGYHEVIFDGTKFASGLYFFRMEAPGYNKIRKMMMVK